MSGARARKSLLMRLYDEDADKYELIYGAEQAPKLREALSLAPPAYPALDVGCGTGMLLRELDALSVGLDLSAGMIRIASSRSKGELVLGDMERMPFRSEAFASVYSITSVQLAEDLLRAMSELARVAKRGAKVVISAHRATAAAKELGEAAALAGLRVLEDRPPSESNVDRMVLCTKADQ